MSDDEVDGAKTCYLCHHPIHWYETTTMKLDADGAVIETHTSCAIRLGAE